MAYSSVISSKGQVTVPQEIRIRLGLKEGDRVEFVVEGGNTIIRPVRSAENPLEAYAGALEGAFPGGVREINAWVDEMRRDKRSRR
jgi:AbrB family looped-hinge helix DNA binding protein